MKEEAQIHTISQKMKHLDITAANGETDARCSAREHICLSFAPKP